MFKIPYSTIHWPPVMVKRSASLAIVAGILACLPLVTHSANIAHAAETEKPGVISVAGTGKVDAAPDMGIISLGIEERAKTARAALDANNRKMTAVMEALKKQGIDDKDLQTSNFSIQPELQYFPRQEGQPVKPPKVVGYRVYNQLTVRVRNLDNMGAVMDEAVTLGVNNTSNVQFTNADPDKIMTEARKLAMGDAMAKAKTLTDAAGVELGRIVNISGGNQGPHPRPYAVNMKADAGGPEAASAVPMAAGENRYTVTVNASWEIKQ